MSAPARDPKPRDLRGRFVGATTTAGMLYRIALALEGLDRTQARASAIQARLLFAGLTGLAVQIFLTGVVLLCVARAG